MADTYEVKITLGDTLVEVSGAQDGVVEIVKALSQILAPSDGGDPAGQKAPQQPRAMPIRKDARTFFEEKKPKSQNEAVVVATYYLLELAPEANRTDTVDAARIEDVLRQAKFKLPKNLKSVLVNTQSAGYLDRVGHGEYKLNPVGWNLVEHTLGPD